MALVFGSPKVTQTLILYLDRPISDRIGPDSDRRFDIKTQELCYFRESGPSTGGTRQKKNNAHVY